MNVAMLSLALLKDIATLSKYLSDFLRMWTERRAKEKATDKATEDQQKQEVIVQYQEWLRRSENASIVASLGRAHDSIEAMKILLAELSQESAENTHSVINAIASQNLSLLNEIKLSAALVNSKIDRIVDALGIIPARIIPLVTSDQLEYFTEKYVDKIKFKFKGFRMFGIPEMLDYMQDLELAYLTLRFVFSDGFDEEIGIRNADHALQRYRHLIIIGLAGSGKTTLLNWLTRMCANAYSEDNNIWKGAVPFFVPLRSLPTERSGRPSLIELHEYAFGGFGQWSRKPPEGWIEDLLGEKRAVLMFDGIDELPPPIRQSFWAWLRDFEQENPGNRIYITSRPIAAMCNDVGSPEWQPLPSFNTARVDDLNGAELMTFVQKWHSALHNYVREDQKTELGQARDSLLAKLKDKTNKHVRDICKTPLLAGMVCALHWKDSGFLPKRHVELYQRCCDLLAEERDRASRVPRDERFRDVGKNDILVLLSRLAFEMLRNGRVADQGQNIEVKKKDACIWIDEHKEKTKCKAFKENSATQVIDFFVERIGILREPVIGVIDFPHRSIQEYLAACAIGPMNQVGSLIREADNDQWRNTILMACGLPIAGTSIAEKFVEGMLDRARKEEANYRYFVAFASCCADASPEEIEDNLRRDLETRIEGITPPRSLEEADAIAKAGTIIIPMLCYSQLKAKDRSVHKVVLSCVRALSQIGSNEAKEELLRDVGYGAISKIDIWFEMCSGEVIEPFEIPSFRNHMHSNKDLWHGIVNGSIAEAIRPFVREVIWYNDPSSIRSLSLKGCKNLRDISGLKELRSLEKLSLNSCTSVTNFSSLANNKSVDHLWLGGCSGLKDISFLTEMHELTRLFLEGCINVSSFVPLNDCAKLEVVDLTGCNVNKQTVDSLREKKVLVYQD